MPQRDNAAFATTAFRPFDDVSAGDFERWYPKAQPAPPPGTFEIGLVLAGAVSAGAYTAGVLDFLFEALDEWCAAKARGENVPQHKVVLRVAAGASAGGINAAIAASACRYRFPHGPDPANPFYAAWVKGVDITQLLDTADLDAGPPVRAVLNCDSLVNLAHDTIDYRGANPADPAARAWLSEGFRVLLTLTNLTGVPYLVRFAGQSHLGHEMVMHRDHIGFEVPFQAPLEAARVPPDVIALPLPNSRADSAWQSLATAALATGAFPMALEPRRISRTRSDYDYRFAYVDGTGQMVNAKPWPIMEKRVEPFSFLTVDGGTMNNEPFDLAHDALAGRDGTNPRSGDVANRALIMIDPFSDYAPTEEGQAAELSILNVGSRLLTAFKDQTRFKPIDLSLAEAENVYSRFLVAPTRASPTKGTIRGHDALASGGLGGFLGFFSEAYRHHDFVLGRVNCRSFLRDAFALPIAESGPRNPIFESWQPALVAPNSPYLCGGRPAHGQIIPLVGALAKRTEDLSWPMDAFSGYDAVQAAIERRVHALYPALRDSLLKRLGFGATLRFLARAYLWLPWFFARRKLIAKLRYTIDGAANKVKLRG